MRLRTRLSIFFLAVVGFIVVGFSVTLYVLSARYLQRQADERLEASINMLAAAAEFNERGVEWEPEERRLAFNRRIDQSELIWTVRDERGRWIDGTTGELAQLWPAEIAAVASNTTLAATTRSGHPWRLRFKRLESGEQSRDFALSTNEPAQGQFHKALMIGVGVSLVGMHATLDSLAMILGALATAVMLATLFVGGRLSREALRPVSAMAEEAHDIGGDEIGRRLPLSRANDELHELGLAFNGLLDRLQEAHERQKRFTGDASHQLRTPLTAIQGQVDVALRHPRSVEEYQRVLTVVRKRAQHLSQIVEALLFLARADAESRPPSLETIDLEAWATAHLARRVETDARGSSRFEVSTAGPFFVSVQPSLLAEMVDNLLDNAARYSAPGSTTTLILSRTENHILLAVKDQGMGIAPEDRPHLFEPFYRSEAARGQSPTGQGLGLSVASRLAKLFGANITVQSKPGQGSTFTIAFPKAPHGPHDANSNGP